MGLSALKEAHTWQHATQQSTYGEPLSCTMGLSALQGTHLAEVLPVLVDRVPLVSAWLLELVVVVRGGVQVHRETPGGSGVPAVLYAGLESLDSLGQAGHFLPWQDVCSYPRSTRNNYQNSPAWEQRGQGHGPEH